jgi:hypothetical protein
MSAAAILRAAGAAGVRIMLNGDRLKLDASAPPPPELLAALREHKAELLRLLQSPAAPSLTGEITDVRDVRNATRAAIPEASATPALPASTGASGTQPDFDAFDERAAREQGFAPAADLHAAVIAGWRAAVAALPPPPDFATQKLHRAAPGFLASPWALEALRLGWDELDLWGLNPGYCWRVRYDGRGLVPLIALAGYPLTIVAMDAAATTLRTPTGSVQTFRRCAFPESRVLWWAHPDIRGRLQ